MEALELYEALRRPPPTIAWSGLAEPMGSHSKGDLYDGWQATFYIMDIRNQPSWDILGIHMFAFRGDFMARMWSPSPAEAAYMMRLELCRYPIAIHMSERWAKKAKTLLPQPWDYFRIVSRRLYALNWREV